MRRKENDFQKRFFENFKNQQGFLNDLQTSLLHNLQNQPPNDKSKKRVVLHCKKPQATQWKIHSLLAKAGLCSFRL